MVDIVHIPRRTKCVRIKDTHKAIALKDFAAIHHVHPRTVLTWITRRRVKGYKTGGRWYIYTDSYIAKD